MECSSKIVYSVHANNGPKVEIRRVNLQKQKTGHSNRQEDWPDFEGQKKFAGSPCASPRAETLKNGKKLCKGSALSGILVVEGDVLLISLDQSVGCCIVSNLQ